MSTRLYYEDAYATQFSAKVIERTQVNGRTALVLDQSYFYPTSGGQPHDNGTLNDVAVVNVLVREEDDAVLHVLNKDLDASLISGEINWPRRFDHMQHHSGQHILSQAFIQVAGAETISFHLSPDSVTIDLDKTELSEAEISQAEALTNSIIWENRPVSIRFVTPAEAQTQPLRKIPPLENAKLRLIDIDNFDLTACGGTHVSQTGAVGLLKILKVERRGQKSRVTFCCGGRALADYGLKHEVAGQLSTLLTTGVTEMATAVTKLQDESRQARRQIKKQQIRLSQLEMEHLLHQSQKFGGWKLVTHVFSDENPAEMRAIGQQIAKNSGVVALLGTAGPKTYLLFCRAVDAPGEMNQLLKSSLTELGSQSGGGTAEIAQGAAPQAPIKQIEAALQNAATKLLGEIGRMG